MLNPSEPYWEAQGRPEGEYDRQIGMWDSMPDNTYLQERARKSINNSMFKARMIGGEYGRAVAGWVRGYKAGWRKHGKANPEPQEPYIRRVENPTVHTPKEIKFKTKAYKVEQSDGSERLAIDWKVNLGRTDCNLRPQDHDYFNSDLFPAILNRYYRSVIGNASWSYVDALPSGVYVTPGFLYTVHIALPNTRNWR